ncbi:MAG: tRNA(Ile)-lysidine synthase [Reinekea sp.]|jgi:tRNA(Ile)-lysidine synthase
MLNPLGWTATVHQDLCQDLRQFGAVPVFVGFSGGVDSSLLLRLACDAFGPERVTAVHINHGLSAQAGQWQDFCQRQAEQLGCQLKTHAGSVAATGTGIEAAARDLRYQQFSHIVTEGGVLLLGHHLDDQIETFFLRLMRGTGLQGLKAMSRSSRRGSYQLYRPLLDLSRQQIESLATQWQLEWIEDDSNAHTRFDRNYLRQTVLPLLEARWPAYRQRVHSLIGLIDSPQADAAFDVGRELQHRLSHDQGLKLVQLDGLTPAQQLSLLHAWLRAIGQQVPSKVRLQEIASAVIDAQADATPEVRLGQGSVRRHGLALYWVADRCEPGPAPLLILDVASDWPGVGCIRLVSADSGPDRLRADLPSLHWRIRAGGEMLRPMGRAKRRDLKRLLQEYRVKPWDRSRLPLLYSGDELIGVADLLLSADHLAGNDEPGLRVIWQNTENAD